MMKFKITLFLTILLVVSLSSCKKDSEGKGKGNFVLDVKAMANGAPMVLKDSVYTNVLQYHFTVERLAFYLSNLYLIKDDGSEVLAKDVAYLKFENNHSTYSTEGEKVVAKDIAEGNYTGIKFAIGVDSVNNHKDPAVFPNDHPLSIYNSAHWDWNSGYIFIKFEGRIDSIPNGNNDLTDLFLYHIGTDPLYTEVSFNHNFSIVAGNDYTYNLKIDIDKLFYSNTDTLDALNESVTHSTDGFGLAQKVTNLLVNAIENE